MSSILLKELEQWDDTICDLAKEEGLDWFPILYEICDYYDMIGNMSYHGMPSHYQHWSYGKSFERTHQFYNLGLEGLPYELIINSNPSISYLMKENPMYLQILIMCHCVGHSDFFKNNRIFSKTSPNTVISKFKNARRRIKKYIEDPTIGLDKVESFLDDVHAIRFQTERHQRKRVPHSVQKSKLIEKINNDEKIDKSKVDIESIPLSVDHDLLGFLIEHGDHFKEWERDILNIVRDESHYFIPQMNTKILNEGWASFWHYRLMNKLDLPQEYHIPFLKSHNQVIRPHMGRLNPYFLGFELFKKIEENEGLDECFLVREVHDDVSAIRCYIEHKDMLDLNLFSYSTKKDKTTIDEVSDIDGWKSVKNDLIINTGVNAIPHIAVNKISESGILLLEHLHDGRDLDLQYAGKVVEHIKNLWPHPVKLFTIIEEEIWEI